MKTKDYNSCLEGIKEFLPRNKSSKFVKQNIRHVIKSFDIQVVEKCANDVKKCTVETPETW
jgi:hypothetical protein